MKAGVIGSNWGRVHVTGLRRAGCEVEAMMAHDAELVARIAAEEGIPCHDTTLAVLDDCELVAIATPTGSHLEYLELLQQRAVLCEKPLGLTLANQDRFDALTGERLFVSYPFPFLDTAQELTRRVRAGELGELTRITLVVGVNLPFEKHPVEWFLEDVVHPFSLLYTLFGDFEWRGVQFGQGNNLSVQMSCGGALVDILLCAWPNEGLHFDLTLVGSREAYQLRGGFRPARSWWMEPLMVDGVATGPAEPATEQIWLRANHRVADAVVRQLQGRLAPEAARALGVFDLARARAMEKLFLPLWRAWDQHLAQLTPSSSSSGKYQ